MSSLKSNAKIFFAVVALGSSTVSGCSGGCESSSIQGDPPTNPAVTKGGIVISTPATIPTFNGAPTNTAIFVHNNTNATISNIEYSVEDVNPSGLLDQVAAKFKALWSNSTVSINSRNIAINQATKQVCSTIPANSSCQLGITTPVGVVLGSSVITAKYQLNNEKKSFSMPVNYQEQVLQDNGIYSTGNVKSFTSVGSDLVYGTVYIYGGGTAQDYVINDIKSSNPAVIISGSTVASGQELASNQVAAFDVTVPVQVEGDATVIADVLVNASLSSTASATKKTLNATSHTYDASAEVVAYAATAAYLTVGFITPIDTSVDNASGSAIIYNAGNAPATGISFSAIPGMTIDPSSCTSLAAAAACSVTLTPTVAGSQGSQVLTVNYVGGGTNTSQTQTVTWYNSKGGVLLSMQVPDTYNLLAATTQAVTVVISNSSATSGVPFTISGVTATSLSGNASISNTSGCDSGTVLRVGGSSCAYNFSFNDTATNNNGTIKILVSGSFVSPGTGESIVTSQVSSVRYITTDNMAVLASNPVSPNVTLAGDGTSVSYESVVITNSGTGSAKATIPAGGVILSNTGGESLSIYSNGCTGAVLNNLDQCIITLKIGPQANTDNSAVTGVESLTINYTSSGQTAPSPLRATVNYTINPNNQSVSIESISAAGVAAGGTGASSTPYVFKGSTLSSGQSITLTVTNPGAVNPVTIRGIMDNINSPLLWGMTNNCAIGTVLQPNKTNNCTIVYKNVLPTYASALQGALSSNFTRNLKVPTFIFTDSTTEQFIVTPNFPGDNATLFVNNQQATISNSVSYSSPILSVSHAIANSNGYPSYSFLMSTESVFTGATTIVAPTGGSLSDCSDSSSLTTSIWTATCAVPAGASGTYTRQYTYNTIFAAGSLHMLFNFVPAANVNSADGYLVDMAPLYGIQAVN